MRAIITGLIALLAWSLSIQWVKVEPGRTASTTTRCHELEVNRLVFGAMGKGVLNHIHNDGKTLWAKIRPTWGNLSRNEKQYLYQSLSCLAQQQDVLLRMVSSKDLDSRSEVEGRQ